MTLLCMDTATDYGTIAVANEGRTLASHAWQSSARHGENLFGHIDRVLGEAGVTRDQIEGIGVGVGPGKFTSLRVGLSAAKGIALALELPIVGVSALRVLARSPVARSSVVRVPLMNAYRGDLFGAAYDFDAKTNQELLEPTFGDPETVLARVRNAAAGRSVVICGEGAKAQLAAAQSALSLGDDGGRDIVVAPAPDALVAEVTFALSTRGPDDLASLEPQYLRPSDAKLPEQPLRVPT